MSEKDLLESNTLNERLASSTTDASGLRQLIDTVRDAEGLSKLA